MRSIKIMGQDKVDVRGYILLAAFMLSIMLNACTKEVPAATQGNYVAQVDITIQDSKESIEEKYQAKVSLWQPELGFALLVFDQKPDISTLAYAAESNQDTFYAPFRIAGSASGSAAWGGGSAVWGGGSAAWGGGSAAWGGGSTAWGGGQGFSGSFAPQRANAAIWDKLDLGEAYDIARTWGAGITVAVIDTGIDLSHPALQRQLSPSSTWYDFVDNDNSPQEVAGGLGYGHGTAVAGIILQVAPEAKIMPLRVLDAYGYGDTDDIVSAIYLAVSYGADIINLSLGSGQMSSLLSTAIDYAYNQGVFVFVSMGNEGYSDNLLFPSSLASSDGSSSRKYNVFAIGSVNASNQISVFSNYKRELNGTITAGAIRFFSYGESIYTLYPEGRTIYATGTSFATPIVTGTMALMCAASQKANFSTRKLYCGENRGYNENLANFSNAYWNLYVGTREQVYQSSGDLRQLLGVDHNSPNRIEGRINIKSTLQAWWNYRN
ncbi:MAG: S8 family serine peptidase [Deinococcales bacterium]